MKRFFTCFAAAAFLVGCAHAPVPADLTAFRAAGPRSILVLPPVNHSLDVDAPNYLLSSLPVPLAEKGYYVFPVNTTKVILEREGVYEADQVREQSPQALANLFGADAILYVTINRWDAQYAVLTSSVTVDFDYRIAFKDGQEIWKTHERMVYSPQNNNTGNPIATLVAAAISAALTRAAPDYMPLARQANARAFVIGPSALPDGPYKVSAQH